MAKRSNEFQQIVTYIVEQLVPFGAKVRESVELRESRTGTLREIDTLIEVDAGIAPVRVAIESRDRSRKDDIQWVDALIGKYACLEIDRVIAVSRSGFSTAAKRKAKNHRIDLLSPEEVNLTDWPAKFLKIGIGSVDQQMRIHSVEFRTIPPFAGKVSKDDQVRYLQGEGGTVIEFIKEMQPFVFSRVHEHINKNILAIYKTRQDLDKIAIIDFPLPGDGLTLVSGDKGYEIQTILFQVAVSNQVKEFSIEHRTVRDRALLTSGSVGDLSAVVVQTNKQSSTSFRLFLSRRRRRKNPNRSR